jgi:hypothetical protein
MQGDVQGPRSTNPYAASWAALLYGWYTAEMDRYEAKGLQKYNMIHSTFRIKPGVNPRASAARRIR